MRIKAIVMGILICSSSNAEIITRCGVSRGKSYYLSSSVLPKAETGWVDDGISQGEILLERTKKNEKFIFDVIAKSAMGMGSLSEDSSEIISVVKETRTLIIGANPVLGVSEHYLFDLDDSGNGQVAWGTDRISSMIPKSSLMVAKCTRP